MSPTVSLELDLLEGVYAIARLAADAPVPSWALGPGLSSVTRTDDELSVLCVAEGVPSGVRSEGDFRALTVRGPLEFDAVGVLLALAEPLAGAGIAILAISTFDTDLVLVRNADLARARSALEDAGHRLPEPRAQR